MRLIDDVLFLEDPDRPGYYHPRISAQHTHVYHSLDEDQKSCFNRLYDDFYYHRHDVRWKYNECLRSLGANLGIHGLILIDRYVRPRLTICRE